MIWVCCDEAATTIRRYVRLDASLDSKHSSWAGTLPDALYRTGLF